MFKYIYCKCSSYFWSVFHVHTEYEWLFAYAHLPPKSNYPMTHNKLSNISSCRPLALFQTSVSVSFHVSFFYFLILLSISFPMSTSHWVLSVSSIGWWKMKGSGFHHTGGNRWPQLVWPDMPFIQILLWFSCR